MIRISLCIDHLSFLVRRNQDTASYRTEAADSRGLLGAFDAEFGPEFGGIYKGRSQIKTQLLNAARLQ